MPSYEAFGWPEGQVYLWTGTATASAVVALAQNTQGVFQRGWETHQSIDGVYGQHLTGQRADVSIGAVYTYDATIKRMVDAATAIHLKLYHSSINGSAGLILYSGVVDAFGLNGSENNPYVYTLQYHCHIWSAYGG